MHYGLPPIARDIERLIGSEALWALVQMSGGIPLYIPASPDRLEGHRLNQVIGVDALKRLCREYGGTKIMMPMMTAELRWRRDSALMARRESGASAAQTAREFGMCQRAAQRAYARAKKGGGCRSKPPKQRSFW